MPNMLSIAAFFIATHARQPCGNALFDYEFKEAPQKCRLGKKCGLPGVRSAGLAEFPMMRLCVEPQLGRMHDDVNNAIKIQPNRPQALVERAQTAMLLIAKSLSGHANLASA